jgi:hypothetical protein
MALWNASEVSTIGNGEHLGRRRFRQPELRGAAGQKPVDGLDTRDFIEKRDRQVSVDRLGRSSVDRKVLRYLNPRAEIHGLSLKREFLGWACIQAGKFTADASKRGYSIEASPITGAEESGSNNYHAHINCPDAYDELHAALYLKDIFFKHGSFVPAEPVSKVDPALAAPTKFRSTIDSLKKMVRELFFRKSKERIQN